VRWVLVKCIILLGIGKNGRAERLGEAILTPSRRALVIGGSMSGLFAALALSRHGWQVDIFERVEGELAGRGAGIVAQPQLRAVFRAVGLDPDVELGVEVRRRRILDRAGEVVGETECPQTLTSWDRLYRMLRDAFPADRYHRGMALERIEQGAASVTAHFAGGTKATGEVLVGADGLRSTVRQQFLPDLAPLYAGYVAWRALIPEERIPAAIHRDLFAYMVFALPPGEQILGYPVAGPNDDLSPGHRRYNLVWYRPADENTELRDLLTDVSGTVHDVSIPPPLIRPEVVEAMRGAAARLVPPQFQEIVRLAAQPFLQPIYDLEAPRIAFGRVAILGDAAFVARPHVAAGVVKAAEDGLALAAALDASADVEQAVRRYEAERIGIGRRIIERARHLGAYLQAELRSAQERDFAARHRTVEAVMAETAVMDFLYR
jgi:2-polyprenyl-6-methoxyphenol hydroxylase-like FAD-dependent oxidoreductase